MSSSLPFLDSTDPRLKLTVHNRIRNVFVTQSEDTRHKKAENVSYIPVVTETSGRVLMTGVNTLQKTLVLKKQAELDEVDEQLALKRKEFQSCVEALAQRRSELETKLQQTQERAMKFEKFVAENEMKRRRALEKYEAAREQNILKQREIEDLTEQMKQLRARHKVLKERMAKYKIYEDYLMKTQDYLPSTYLDNGSDSLVIPIIRRHETLSITRQELLQRLEHLEEEVEQGQQQLYTMTQEHSIKKLTMLTMAASPTKIMWPTTPQKLLENDLGTRARAVCALMGQNCFGSMSGELQNIRQMAIKELSELQGELETLKEKNKQTEDNLLMERGLSREKVEEVGTLVMAINNLAEQCYLAAYGPLENMTVLTMMDMVKDYLLDKADTEKRARRLMESGSAMTSRTALTDRRERGSMKSISSKTQIKSSSKVSRKSEAMS